MADNQVVLLSVLADRPYWMSILEILGPPAGVSFYRPFDYRSDWVDEDLLGKLQDGSGFFQSRAIVGMRFRDDDHSGATGRFIPLREAEAALRRNGNVSVSLLLGEHVQLDDGQKDLQHLDIPGPSRDKGGEPVLARVASSNEQQQLEAWRTRRRPDHRIWDALATSSKLPQAVRERFRDRVVLYSSGVSLQKTGQQLAAQPIASRQRGATTVGYKFTVGQTYDVDLQMRRIGGPGQAVFPEAPDFEFITDTDRVTPSAPVVPFSGNYREVRTWVRPRVKQPAPLDLWWHPREHPTLPGENRPANVALRIPVVVKTKVPWVMALLAVLLVLAGAALYSFAGMLAEDKRNFVSTLIAGGTVVLSFGTALILRIFDQYTSQG